MARFDDIYLTYKRKGLDIASGVPLWRRDIDTDAGHRVHLQTLKGKWLCDPDNVPIYRDITDTSSNTASHHERAKQRTKQRFLCGRGTGTDEANNAAIVRDAASHCGRMGWKLSGRRLLAFHTFGNVKSVARNRGGPKIGHGNLKLVEDVKGLTTSLGTRDHFPGYSIAPDIDPQESLGPDALESGFREVAKAHADSIPVQSPQQPKILVLRCTALLHAEWMSLKLTAHWKLFGWPMQWIPLLLTAMPAVLC